MQQLFTVKITRRIAQIVSDQDIIYDIYWENRLNREAKSLRFCWTMAPYLKKISMVVNIGVVEIEVETLSSRSAC